MASIIRTLLLAVALVAIPIPGLAQSHFIRLNLTNDFTNATSYTLPKINNRLVALLGGFTSTNDGYGGLFVFNTNATDTIDLMHVFGSHAGGRWLRLNSILRGPLITTVTGDLDIQTGGGNGNIKLDPHGSGLVDVYAEQLDIFSTTTLASIHMENSGNNKFWLTYEGANADTYVGSSGTRTLRVTAGSPGTFQIENLTGNRVVYSDSNKALQSVGAPAADGYVLSSTIGGTLSWVANTAGSTGANPTAAVGLTAVNGSASTFLRSDGAPPLDQSIAPTWTGAHNFANTIDFKPATAYDGSPVGLLNGTFKYNSGGSFSTMARLQMGKENTTDGNTAGYLTLSTRVNGGNNLERVRITSTGKVGINADSPSAYLHVMGDAGTEVAEQSVVSAWFQQSASASANSYVGIVSGTSGVAGLLFGDTADQDIGRIYYDHATDSLALMTSNTDRVTISSSGVVNISNLTASQPVFTDGSKNLISQATIPYANLPNQTLNSQYTDIGNVGAGEDNLMTYTLAAGKLASNGDRLVVRTSATTSSAANAKTWKLYVFGSIVQTVTAPTGQAYNIVADIEIIRVNSATVRVQGDVQTTVGGNQPMGDIGGLTLANSQIIKCTGTGTSDNDVVQKTMTVEYHAAP